MSNSFLCVLVASLLSVSAVVSCKKNNTTVTPSAATVSAITCGSAVFSVAAASGTAYTGTVSVPYTGGSGVAYAAGSAIASTGVTGLNATLQAGTLATGAGNLTYTVSGTPSGAGTATFPLSFGGQTCSLPLTVSAPGSTTTVAVGSCSGVTGVAQVVCLAEAFKATLTATQLAAVQLTFTKANAQKWSNLPAALSARIGIRLDALSSTQQTAFYALMSAVLAQNVTNEGYDELVGSLVADDYLSTVGGGSDYGRGNFYLSFLGTPSTTGLWELLFTGHHYTQPYIFNAGKVTGITPAFRAIEPMAAVTANNRTYQAVEQERAAFADMIAGLSTTEQATAKLSTSFNDIVLGPGKDGQFPATKVGLKVGDLSAAKQALVLNAIKLYVNDLDAATAAAILAKYTTELPNTYIAYAGTGTMTPQGDYVRIDGPGVWIEYNSQGGVIIRNTPHPHSVWRDHTTDYGGN